MGRFLEKVDLKKKKIKGGWEWGGVGVLVRVLFIMVSVIRVLLDRVPLYLVCDWYPLKRKMQRLAGKVTYIYSHFLSKEMFHYVSVWGVLWCSLAGCYVGVWGVQWCSLAGC